MGFFVRFDASEISTNDLVNVSQNFIKYEDILDQICLQRFPGMVVRVLESNREMQECHQALERCRDDNNITSLVKMMNPKRNCNYKLCMLQNSDASSPLTLLEFRQHPAILDFQDMSTWIRL